MAGPSDIYEETDPAPRKRKHQDDEPGTIREVVVTIAAALLLAYFVQAQLVKPYRIPSGSMENTLKCGDRVLVDRLSSHFRDIERGDVVVFHPPAGIDEQGKPDPTTIAGEGESPPRDKQGNRHVTEADVNYIKRVIGLPGDTVEVHEHHAYINGKKLDEPYLHPLPKDPGLTSESEWGPQKVPKGTYLMLGDNRDNSADGRVFGFVPKSFVIGRAFMVYWPPARIGGLPDKDPGGADAAKPDPNCLESSPA
jgi:signal peptidase I